jgi:rare lipoprotein A
MKSSSFQTIRQRSAKSIRNFGAGVLMMGIALTALAKDTDKDSSAASGKEQAPAVKTPRAKVVSRAKRWFQVGVASWYGARFQGRATAGGERFDMNEMTCAHPTLPMGTWLRVTNLKNRKTAYVRVNDRGPVVEGRIVDLSYAAARAVGLVGVGQVKLEAVRENDPGLAQALVARLQMPLLFSPVAQH